MNILLYGLLLQVEVLDLSQTTLKSVPEALITYVDIVSLNLSFNEITSVTRYAFARMWKLRTLDLSGNKIRSVSDMDAGAVFLSNARLQFLNLSRNPIIDLGDEYGRILYSESLQTLDLSHCSISHVQGPLVLQGLPKLSKLNLSSNPLTRLDGLSSDSLMLLDLSHCNIQFLRSDSFSGLSKLKELRCSSNSHLSDQFFKPVSRSLSYLDTSYCDLDTNYASELTEASTVLLKGNQLKEIIAYAFQNNTKLEWLDLSENLIKTINEFAFYGAESLRHLDLSENSIFTISDNTFTFTPFLLTLNLSRNSIRSLNQLKGSSVIVLDISKCELSAISSKSLIHLPSVQILNMSYNFLENLPENLTSYSLQSLDASYCRVTTLSHYTFNRLPALVDINLSGNRLVYLRNNIFVGLNKLNQLTLTNNPWKCDCYDENFKKLWKNIEHLPSLSPLICIYPENVTGQQWHEACTKEWNGPQRRSKDIIILSIIVLVLLISGIIACVVAIKEGMNVRANRRREQELEAEHSGHIEHGDSSENDQIRESVRKFTQLPSYDEALLLPKPPSSSSFDTAAATTPRIDRHEKSKKRQSATQTEETIEALLQQIEASEGNESPELIRRASLQEIEYINIRPLRLQCTEL